LRKWAKTTAEMRREDYRAGLPELPP